MPHEIQVARSSRRTPTIAERRLWTRLRRHGVGWHFRRQHPVPPFVLDFACPTLGIAIEADGGQHAWPGEHDARDSFLRQRGWMVLRFWNNDILANTNGIVAVIREACELRARRRPHPSPPPLRGRGGV